MLFSEWIYLVDASNYGKTVSVIKGARTSFFFSFPSDARQFSFLAFCSNSTYAKQQSLVRLRKKTSLRSLFVPRSTRAASAPGNPV